MAVGKVPDALKPLLNLGRRVSHHHLHTPIQNAYQPPDALGIDRLVVATAGALRYGVPLLALTIGTTLTVTFVNQYGTIVGGSISPGLRLRFKSLTQNTALLPEVRFHKPPDSWLGCSTQESIWYGVAKGYLAELQALFNWWAQYAPDATVWAGGGDSHLLQFVHCPLPLHLEPFIEIDALAYLDTHGFIRWDATPRPE